MSVAIYHLSVKPIRRAQGRSATGAAAYRAGARLLDERTGLTHDYTRRRGVEWAAIVVPPGAPEWATDRAKLWNTAELAEKRKDACVAREVEVALPAEISTEDRRRLVLNFARWMVEQEGCVVDVAVHAPHRQGDARNFHAHILRTTRRLDAGAGSLGGKVETEKAGRDRKEDLAALRASWEIFCNAALEKAGHTTRIDHRSLEVQQEEAIAWGDEDEAHRLDREPTRHLGVAATGIERKTKTKSRVRQKQEQATAARAAAKREAALLSEARRLAAAREAQAVAHLAQLGKEREARVVAWRARLVARRLVWGQKGGQKATVAPLGLVPSRARPVIHRWAAGKAQGLAAVRDYGDRIEPCGSPDKVVSDAKIWAMLEICRAKDWTRLVVTGPQDFKARFAQAARAAGFEMEGELDEDRGLGR